jgi:N-ethylmaleimide reductase
MSQPLLEPGTIGEYTLKNRVVMAPMTRCRADNPGNVPTALMADYYAQRASAGLLITEGTFVSPRAVGYINVPGLYSQAQTEGWRGVTNKVHASGGRIFAQLWHVGAMSHPDLLGGELPYAPSAVNPGDRVFTLNGFSETVTPRAMTPAEIDQTIEDFVTAAANAVAAGFDGVELHAANGYLFHQFFANSTNRRTDRYGGGFENRMRFLLETIERLSAVIPASQIGVRLNPAYHGHSGVVIDEETTPFFEALVAKLDTLGIAYLHLMEPIDPIQGLPVPQGGVAKHFRRYFGGAIISATDHGRASGNALLESGGADFIAFGRAFISNPDLVDRFDNGIALAEPRREFFYTGGATGYTDYPTFAEAGCGGTVSPDIRVSDRYGETRARMKRAAGEAN